MARLFFILRVVPVVLLGVGASVWAEDANVADTWWSLGPRAAGEAPRLEEIPKRWGGNPIDAFVLRKLRENGLKPSGQADRITLIRRVSLDLTGLPPTPQQVDAFVNDRAEFDVAYGRLVDRLLASERYGERWAQHWLDVIRWAETVGFETNIERQEAWPYRDWVINALNSDKPYDQFIFEQIAGDTVAQDAALGFLVAGPAIQPGQIGRDESAMRQARQDEMDEVIRTVGQSLFGLTFGCARCHDHMFDPIKQAEYYGLQAIFEGLSYGNRRLRGPMNDDWTRRLPAARQAYTKRRAELESMRKELRLRAPLLDVQVETFKPVFATAMRMRIAATGAGKTPSLYELEVWSAVPEDGSKSSMNVALASNGARPSASSFALANQTRHYDNLVDGSIDKRQAFPWQAGVGGPAWVRIDLNQPTMIDQVVWHKGSSIPADYVIEVLHADDQTWVQVAHTHDRQPRVDDKRKPADVHLSGLSTDQTTRLMKQIAAVRSAQRNQAQLAAGPQVFAASFNNSPGHTFALHRGDAMQRKDRVGPMVPEALGDLNLDLDAPEVDRRLALARDLTRADHPLTARVMVNRIWQHHFGVGLVETSSDFGTVGAAPSHPQLLDWLADAFVNGGWSIKQLHRLIVHSSVYRQASAPRESAMRIDAGSRLLWRFPPRRLEAEAIRDSILNVSGKLNLTMGGSGFDFFDQRGGLSGYTPKETFDKQGWRRMIYAHKIRMQSVDIFGAFDCPDAGQMKPNRTQSITPIQSLSLMNSPFVMRQAGFFAQRIRRDAGDDVASQIDTAYRLAYSRAPTAQERQRLGELATRHGLEQVCRVLFNSSEFVYIR